jgi:hypothetical protein
VDALTHTRTPPHLIRSFCRHAEAETLKSKLAETEKAHAAERTKDEEKRARLEKAHAAEMAMNEKAHAAEIAAARQPSKEVEELKTKLARAAAELEEAKQVAEKRKELLNAQATETYAIHDFTALFFPFFFRALAGVSFRDFFTLCHL